VASENNKGRFQALAIFNRDRQGGFSAKFSQRLGNRQALRTARGKDDRHNFFVMAHRGGCGRIIDARRNLQGLSVDNTNICLRGLRNIRFALPLGGIPTKMPSALRSCYSIQLKCAAP
jgi:hypothetical protein